MSIEERFVELNRQWHKETLPVSSTEDMCIRNKNYQEIISLGKEVIPFILKDLQKSYSHWFYALQKITGENPILEEHRGYIKEMANDWIQWGKMKGYI